MTEREDWRASRRKRWEAAAIAAAGYPLVAGIGSTLRWRTEGLEHLEDVERSERAPILGFWHGRILSATWFFRRRGIVVITSDNFDGEWIARIIARLGYGTARGSTSYHAGRALRQLVREVRAGHPAGFTLDGPRGPACRAQPGAVWLAKATGSPILLFHAEAERFWSAHSWDRTQVPKPFSRVALVMAPPLTVPADADDERLEQTRRDVEGVLAGLQRRALEMLRTPGNP